MTGTRQKINSHSRSVLRLRVCVFVFLFFFFQFKLVTKLQFNCVHITNLPRLAFEFFFVEFPSVADGKTEKKNPSKRKTGFQDQSLYIYIYIFIYLFVDLLQITSFIFQSELRGH